MKIAVSNIAWGLDDTSTIARLMSERGIAAVQCLEGDAVWQAAADGLWSRELAEAAAATGERPEGRMEDLCRSRRFFSWNTGMALKPR